MDEKKFVAKNTLSVFDEVEGHLEKLMSMKRDEIQKDLHSKIRQEQEEAERRISSIADEFSKGRDLLVEYKTVLVEFENERVELENGIRHHFNKAIDFQTEIERLAGLTLDELRKVNELNHKLESLNIAADERTSGMRKDLAEKFGIVAEVAETRTPEDFKVNLSQELLKLKKIKDLLESEGVKLNEPKEVRALEPPPMMTEAAPVEIPQESTPDLQTGNEEIVEKIVAAEEPSPKSSGNSFKVLFERIEPYRRMNTEDGNGGITYFQNNRTSILDGERLMSAIADNLEEIKKLFQKLPLADTPKSLFFIKQDIINHQESLRKTIGHVVRLCDKEGWDLPRFTVDVLNIQVLKDLLDRLNTENWSNEADFSSFATFVESLRNSYYEKISPPAVYLRSVIDELGIN